MPVYLPPQLADDTRRRIGPRGAEWVSKLPALVERCERRWGITAGPPFVLSYNYVVGATQTDGSPAVLKVSPYTQDLASEAEALRFFDGRGAARLLADDLEIGALLLERVEPGTSVEHSPEEAAISAAADVLRRLHRPVALAEAFPTTRDWGKAFAEHRLTFAGSSGPLPGDLFVLAERLFAELLASSGPPILLHGDLHFGNVLAAQRQPWLCIDPKGVVGEAEYDTCDLLRNRVEEILSTAQPVRAMRRRIDQIADELGFQPERIRAWGLSQAVLSAIWSIEDNETGYQPVLRAAELLREA